MTLNSGYLKIVKKFNILLNSGYIKIVKKFNILQVYNPLTADNKISQAIKADNNHYLRENIFHEIHNEQLRKDFLVII